MIARVLWTMAAVLISGAAAAHHMEGGTLPATWSAGLLSGLGHPVIGWDHLAFVVGIGVLAAGRRSGGQAILAFLAGTLAGCLIHLASLDLPGGEVLIGVSLVALGAALVLALGRRAGVVVALAAAGLVHGYAYGESIVGAEPAPLAAYLVGFAIIQAAIAFAARWIAARAALAVPGMAVARTAGVAVAVVGVVALTLA